MSALINRIVFQAVDVRQMAKAWLDDGLTGLPLAKLSPDEIIAMDLRVQEMQEDLLDSLGYPPEERNCKPRRPMSLSEINALPDEDDSGFATPLSRRRGAGRLSGGGCDAGRV